MKTKVGIIFIVVMLITTMFLPVSFADTGDITTEIEEVDIEKHLMVLEKADISCTIGLIMLNLKHPIWVVNDETLKNLIKENKRDSLQEKLNTSGQRMANQTKKDKIQDKFNQER